MKEREEKSAENLTDKEIIGYQIEYCLMRRNSEYIPTETQKQYAELVLEEGIKIQANNEKLRINFEVKTMQGYFDLKPFF